MCKFGHSEKEHCEALAHMLTPYLTDYGIEYRFRPAGTSLAQAVKDVSLKNKKRYFAKYGGKRMFYSKLLYIFI